VLLQKKEELWTAPAGVPYMILIHTNSVMSNTEEMVLSQGAAAQARQLYSKLPRMFYKKLREIYPTMPLNGTEDYGFLPIIDPPSGIGAFQIKRHWGSLSNLETILRSTSMLAEYAEQNPGVHIRMTFPPSGEKRWGKKDSPNHELVEEILYSLPNNVHIVDWET